MPIGGGSFTVQNKVLPGAYINFVSMGTNAKMGERGVAALPLELNWGPEGQVFKLDAADFNATSMKVFGYDPTDANILLVREAMKRAKTLLIYRVNGGGTKASATVGGMTVTAKYGGTRGNAIKVAVITNVDDATKADVVTYLDDMVMDSQTVAKSGGAASLVANDFVTFGTVATLAAATATPLTGGANTTVNAAKHTAALTAFEVETFNMIGYPGTVEDIKSLYAAFVKRLRDDEGKKIVGVLYGYDGDNMGLINVKNGVVLTNGTTITGDKAVAWVTGASAGAEVNESLTNTAYDDAVDVDIKYTKSQFEAAIKAGEFVFYADYGKARVLTDINSLTTIGQNMSSDWVSNRVVRVMDGWANDVARILLWNQPPTAPSSITYGTPQAGQNLTLSTGGSTDPEGDAISYVWERKVDSGVWTQIGITTAKTIQDTVPSSGTTYYARVKAADAVGNESAYCTGSGKAISYNTPPVISGSDQNMGAKTDPFTYKYTVTDAQSATQALTVTETLTNGAETIALRTYTATAGAQNTADLSSVWIRLIAGTHVLKITASDGAGGTAVRNITFSRTVTRIAAARAFNTDAKVTKVFVSLYPSDRPAGSTLHLEVTNNPFDTNPVWEDITEKANRLVHTFANSTVANGYGLGYRFYLLKGTEEIEITQATIRFA